MSITKKDREKTIKRPGPDFLERLGEDGWTYIKTVVDILREPVLILDKDLRVMASNEAFHKMFQVESRDTDGKVVYELGNGQWNIPALRKLLESILPKNTFFKGFEVAHTFPYIGRKVMILNAREIHCKDDPALEPCPPIILLAIDDVTEMITVAEKLADHTNKFEAKLGERTQKLEIQIRNLEEVINTLQKTIQKK